MELIRAGTLDAELAATLWVLIEGRVPLVVAAEASGVGQVHAARGPARLPPAGRPRRSSWPARTRRSTGCRRRPSSAGPAVAPGAPPLPRDATASSRSVPTTPSCSIPELSDHLPSYTWGDEARLAIRAASIGYGLAATIHADSLDDVFEALRRPPVRLDDDELSRLGVVLVLRRRRRRAASRRRGALRPARPPATCTATSSASARPCWRPGIPRPTPSSTSAGGSSPSWRSRVGVHAGDLELDVDRRRDYLAGLADAGPDRGRRRSGAPSTASAQHRPTTHPPTARDELEDTDAEPRAPRHDRRAPRPPAGGRGPSRTSFGPTCSRASRPAPRSCPGIVGYDDTVVPAIENAILAGQDLVFLGERGQAKTRMARALVGLLDEWLPVIRGGELNDDPFAPVSPAARAIVERDGDDAAIDWLPRDRRYAEKLATPDITIADLIGEVDPIKVAEGRYLSDELTLHYGLIPRANRGIVAINELPDLAERIQVGLLNILEERDVQIRGFVVRLPLDLFVVASANPEDYTSRGRIITPLKDRLGSQIRTHYPRTLEDEMAIVRQEKRRFEPGDGVPPVVVPHVHGGARRRADAARPPLPGDQPALGRQRPGLASRTPRSSRPPRSSGPSASASRSARRASRTSARSSPRRSARSSSNRSATTRPRSGSSSASSPRRCTRPSPGTSTSTSSTRSSRRSRTGSSSRPASAPRRASTSRGCARCPGLDAAVDRLGTYDVTDGAEEPAVVASAVEFLLEGLHLARRINKDRIAGGTVYHR